MSYGVGLRNGVAFALGTIASLCSKNKGNGVTSGALLVETTGFFLLEDGTSHFLFG